MTKVYIDGSEGTTGLRIFERFQGRDDIEVLKIDPEKRKDKDARAEMINSSDITFLCLPDAAAIEAVSLVENENVRIIDASTAHRTADGWAYGFPELSKAHREAVVSGKRIANPGCHASGFIALTYPLVAAGVLPKDAALSCFSLTGYSGGGKKMIAQYETEEKETELFAPRPYGLTQQHKHLKEMKAVCGLEKSPIFTPIVDDYYAGMLVGLPLFSECLKDFHSPEKLAAFYAEYYAGQKMIQVLPPSLQAEKNFLAANALTGKDTMAILVTGNEERMMAYACFDNLGKGASGAAIQSMNLMIGCDEAKGLSL